MACSGSKSQLKDREALGFLGCAIDLPLFYYGLFMEEDNRAISCGGEHLEFKSGS